MQVDENYPKIITDHWFGCMSISDSFEGGDEDTEADALYPDVDEWPIRAEDDHLLVPPIRKSAIIMPLLGQAAIAQSDVTSPGSGVERSLLPLWLTLIVVTESIIQ